VYRGRAQFWDVTAQAPGLKIKENVSGSFTVGIISVKYKLEDS